MLTVDKNHLIDEKQLLIKLQLLQQSQAATVTGAWEWDMQKDFLLLTNEMFRVLEMPVTPDNTVPFQKIIQFIHPEDRLRFPILRQEIQQLDKIETEIRLITGTGKLITVHAWCNRIKNDKSEYACLRGSIQDITRQRQLELELLRVNRELELRNEYLTQEFELNNELELKTAYAEMIINSSSDCIAVFDTELRIIEWNQKCEEFYKVAKKEVLGKKIDSIFPNVRNTERVRNLQLALEGRIIYSPEVEGIEKKGYFRNTVMPLKDASGQILGVLAVTEDITELKNSAESLKHANQQLEQKNRELMERTYFDEALLDASADLISAFDRNLNVIVYNKACETVLGKTKKEVLGKNVLEVFPHLKGSQRIADLKRAFDGELIHHRERVNTYNDGYNENFIIPLKHENGDVFGVLAIAHDITEFKNAVIKAESLNRELAEKNIELERMNTELAAFSYIASHDLQEPLRKIQAFSDLVLGREQSNLSEAGKDYFNRMHSAAQRMQIMLADLLSFSRASNMTGNFEITDLKEVIDDVKESMKDKIEASGAIVQCSNLPVANVIRSQLRQLFENIISNAIKFQAPGNKPVIIVSYNILAVDDLPHFITEQKEFVHISITDNGIGFEQEYSEQIFQLFKRLNGKSEYSGSGIGLAICKKIIQNHNGYIVAQSSPGAGSTFHLYIPAE
jgi:PAS domain S-box-containing protein